MSELYQNYMMKVEKIDERICAELQKELQINFENGKEKVIEDENVQKVYTIIEEKKKMIFSLFEGDFESREKELKEQISKGQIASKQNSIHTAAANTVLFKRINKAMNNVLDSKNVSTLERITIINRKKVLEKILQENFAQKEQAKEEMAE